jgi:hypothetical protein
MNSLRGAPPAASPLKPVLPSRLLGPHPSVCEVRPLPFTSCRYLLVDLVAAAAATAAAATAAAAVVATVAAAVAVVPVVSTERAVE